MNETKSVMTRSAEETIAWGREFARRLRAPVLVLLTGDLGQREDDVDEGDCGGPGGGG